MIMKRKTKSKYLKQKRDLYKYRVKKKLCTKCGILLDNNIAMKCTFCLSLLKEYDRRWRKLRKRKQDLENRCYKCNKKKSKRDCKYKTCFICRQRNATYRIRK